MLTNYSIEKYSPKEEVHTGLKVLDLGLMDYLQVYEFQKKLIRDRFTGMRDTLIFVQHPTAYTYGRAFKGEMARKGFRVERGGGVTLHNPGQLVCYPILALQGMERDLGAYLRNLEEVSIRVLKDFGIESERREGATGVWLRTKNKKIVSIGVAVSRWVTYHGCALNVENDLCDFSNIHPCGFPSEVMTSMKTELGEHCPSLTKVKDAFLRKFCLVFGRTLV